MPFPYAKKYHEALLQARMSVLTPRYGRRRDAGRIRASATGLNGAAQIVGPCGVGEDKRLATDGIQNRGRSNNGALPGAALLVLQRRDILTNVRIRVRTSVSAIALEVKSRDAGSARSCI